MLKQTPTQNLLKTLVKDGKLGHMVNSYQTNYIFLKQIMVALTAEYQSLISTSVIWSKCPKFQEKNLMNMATTSHEDI